MLEIILADLRRIFGNKVLLSPEDIEEIIDTSVGQQANLRSEGRFPIPWDKDGFGRVKISIYDLAQYIANIGKNQVKQTLKQEIVVAPDKPTRLQKKARKGHLERDWWAWRQLHIVSIIRKSVLDYGLSNVNKSRKPKNI